MYVNSPKHSSFPSLIHQKQRYFVLKWVLIVVVIAVINVNITLYLIRRRGTDLPEDSLLIQHEEENVDKRIQVLQKEIDELSSIAFASHIPVLPSFTTNGADYVLGSIIERAFDAYGPYVTTFFLSHQMLQAYLINGMGIEKVSTKMRPVWKQASIKFEGLEYEHSGKRSPKYNYICNIANSANDKVYSVRGEFLSNRLSSDVNSNRRIDILRCPIHDAINATEYLRYSNHEIQMEIVLDRISLVKFTVPWRSRRTGYMLTSIPMSSHLDAWRVGSKHPNKQDHDSPVVHMNMPGSRLLMSKKNLAVMVEYVSHHLLVGFEHIYFTIALGANKKEMKNLLHSCRSYIDEGSLTITSSSGDGIDSLAGSDGLQWHTVALKTFQTTMYLYYAKGFADYLAVFDVDELFIPKASYSSITDIIRDMDYFPANQVPSTGKRKTKGFADGHDHPFCFILIRAEVIARPEHDVNGNESPWIGTRLGHGSEYNPHDDRTKRFAYSKVIYPTRRIYQAGIGNAGACRLDWQWTPCSQDDERQFCEKGYNMADTLEEEHQKQHFDEVVKGSDDSKTANPWQEAVAYHFLIYHDELHASVSALMNTSDYTKKYFPKVLSDLRNRQLDFLLTIPDKPKTPYGAVPNTWSKLFSKDEIHESQANQPADRSPVVPIGMTINSFPPLPKNFSYRHEQVEVDLPDFTIDYTDFVLGSMVERESGSYNLFITTFFLCHSLLEPQVGASAATIDSIHPTVIPVWKKAMRVSKSTLYTENGERQQPPRYFCKITHSSSSSSYYTNGRFVPNRLTPDSNSNRRLDILRCPMEGGEDAYRHLDQYKQQDEHVVVEIYRDKTMLIRFRIPWLVRMTGYMLSPPPPALLQQQLISTFDPWQHVDVSQPPSQWNHDRLYMCVPGLESAPDKITLPLYLEFIEHHLQLGVDRIFIVASLAWGGRYMQTYLRVWEDYIKEGRISVQSSSYDGYDLVYSVGGLGWARDNPKNFYVNMCTYFSKGVADYVAVWDFDELFTPMGKYQNILDLIDEVDVSVTSPIPYTHSVESKEIDIMPSWKGGKGLADGDGHPLCFIALNSYVTLRQKAWQSEWDYSKPWIGQRFAHGQELTLKDGKGLAFVKTIRPTRVAFQGGLHHVGACRLPPAWDGCSVDDTRAFGSCYRNNGEIYRVLSAGNGSYFDFHKDHRFDEVVTVNDAKQIKFDEAYINHIQFHRVWFGATPDALSRRSEYSDRFFHKVYQALDQRNLELPMSLPEKSSFVIRNDKLLLLATDGWIPVDFLLQPKPSPDADTSSILNVPATLSLPTMSADGSEVIMAAMIDGGHVSIHFLSHYLLSHEASSIAKDHILGVQRDSASRWQHFLSPSERHPRSQSQITCVLRNHAMDEAYEVPGQWIEPVLNSSHQPALDILRCAIHVPMEAHVLDHYRENVIGHKDMSVIIKRGEAILGSYIIPWHSRVVSAFLAPSLNGTTSTLNPWLGVVDLNSSTIIAPSSARHRIVMCISGYDITPARQSIAWLLESIQHHLLLGIDHIFLSVGFASDSSHLKRLERIYRPFIQQGQLSIFSNAFLTSGSMDTNFLYGMQGLAWSHGVGMAIQDELCVSYAQGFADYVAIWNLHDFLFPSTLPSLSSSSSSSAYEKMSAWEMITSAEKQGLFKCAKEVHVNDATPFAGITTRYPCYLKIPGHILHSYSEDIQDSTIMSFWLGDLFPYAPEGKGVREPFGDRNKIFRVNNAASSSSENMDIIGSNQVAFSYYFDDSKVSDDSRNKARLQLGKNLYYESYFPIVRQKLREKKLDLLVDIPLRIKPPATPNLLWTIYMKVWDERDT